MISNNFKSDILKTGILFHSASKKKGKKNTILVIGRKRKKIKVTFF